MAIPERAINGFGQNASAGCFADAAWTAEKVGLGQLPFTDSVSERGGDMVLSNQLFKSRGPVFAGRNLIFLHLVKVKRGERFRE